ncbi:nucleoside deaminase [Pontibacter rugosus]|uniref:Nucleoside deaminase n=1 Tax=Pontibacter rugosus TaxID=1745966 RepID=A0ABW3STE2_9BACT
MEADINLKNRFMREALQLSEEKMLEGFGGPFGAVVVRQGNVIARGYNNVLASQDPTAHAEVDALRKAAQVLKTHDLSDCELYTSCEPCPMCLGAIYWARIKKVYYGNTHLDAARVGFDDSFIYEEMKKPHEERQIPMEQILPGEAAKAFEIWEQLENKKMY